MNLSVTELAPELVALSIKHGQAFKCLQNACNFFRSWKRTCRGHHGCTVQGPCSLLTATIYRLVPPEKESRSLRHRKILVLQISTTWTAVCCDAKEAASSVPSNWSRAQDYNLHDKGNFLISLHHLIWYMTCCIQDLPRYSPCSIRFCRQCPFWRNKGNLM